MFSSPGANVCSQCSNRLLERSLCLSSVSLSVCSSKSSLPYHYNTSSSSSSTSTSYATCHNSYLVSLINQCTNTCQHPSPSCANTNHSSTIYSYAPTTNPTTAVLLISMPSSQPSSRPSPNPSRYFFFVFICIYE